MVVTDYKADQGDRDHMEDRYVCYSEEGFQCSGVFDGHGGYATAEYLKNNLHKELRVAFCKLQSSGKTSSIEVSSAIVSVFEKVDRHLCSLGYSDGSTAAIVICIWGDIYMCNLGDSRIVWVDSRSQLGATLDHKPELGCEQERIELHGGYVSTIVGDVPRINGVLAVSRAFGDFFMKEDQDGSYIPDGLVSIRPHITVIRAAHLCGGYIIVGTDGLWDVVTSDNAVSYVNSRGSCDRLIAEAQRRRSRDNIAILKISVERQVPSG